MKFFARLRSFLSANLRRQSMEDGLRDELQFHLEQRAEHLIAQGLAPEEARRRAIAEIGPLAATQEECRQALGLRIVDSLHADLRQAWRQMRAAPGFTLVAVFSMALGIGACTAVYSVIHAVLIDTHPYRDADRIIHYGDVVSGATFEEWRKLPALEDGMATDLYHMSLTSSDPPEAVSVGRVSANAFQFLGVPPLVGRMFGPDDGESRVAVLAYGLWRKQYGGDPEVAGKTLQLDHKVYTIVGVAPPRLTWKRSDIFIPAEIGFYRSPTLEFAGRLRPGATIAQVQSQALANLRERYATLPADFRVTFRSLRDVATVSTRATLLLFLAVVLVLLAIACSNVSILLLARGAARQHELSLRAAIGASRSRLIAQLLTESLLLTLAGGVLGAGLAYLGLDALLRWLPADTLPPESNVRMSVPVLVWSAITVMLTGFLAGLVPALRFSRLGVYELIQAAKRLTGSSGSQRMQRVLVGSQVALTVMLLTGAVTAVRALIDLQRTTLGYDPTRLLRVTIPTAEGALPAWEQRKAYFQAIAREVKAIAGVEYSSFAPFYAPFWGGNLVVDLPGQPPDPRRRSMTQGVSAQFFQALRIPLREGRTWTEADTERAAPVAVVNEEMARQFWPSGGALGQQIRLAGLTAGQWSVVPEWSRQPLEVIGIVGNVRNRGLHEPPGPAAYIPYTLQIPDNMALIVRTLDPGALVPAVRQAVAAAAPGQAITAISTGEEVLRDVGWQKEEIVSTLFTAFAGLALALAAIGLYSALAYATATRSQEFGIRIALGARGRDLIRLVLGPAAVTVSLGIVVGLGASLAATRVLASYAEVTLDAWVAGCTAGVVVAVALGATLAPAWRAARTDPACNLRE